MANLKVNNNPDTQSISLGDSPQRALPIYLGNSPSPQGSSFEVQQPIAQRMNRVAEDNYYVNTPNRGAQPLSELPAGSAFSRIPGPWQAVSARISPYLQGPSADQTYLINTQNLQGPMGTLPPTGINVPVYRHPSLQMPMMQMPFRFMLPVLPAKRM